MTNCSRLSNWPDLTYLCTAGWEADCVEPGVPRVPDTMGVAKTYMTIEGSIFFGDHCSNFEIPHL